MSKRCLGIIRIRQECIVQFNKQSLSGSSLFVRLKTEWVHEIAGPGPEPKIHFHRLPIMQIHFYFIWFMSKERRSTVSSLLIVF